MEKEKIDIKIGEKEKRREKNFQYIIAACFAILVIRLFYLQIIRGQELLEASNKNRVNINLLEAPRGKIYDRNGKILASNFAGYRLIYKNGRRYDSKVVSETAELLKMSNDNVEKMIGNGEIIRLTGENIILNDIDEEKAHKIIERLTDYPYLKMAYYPKRFYNEKTLASHLIGYTSKITQNEYKILKDEGYRPDNLIGKKGVEKSYDHYLQGIDGFEVVEVDARSRFVETMERNDPVFGDNVYLSLDYRLQSFMTELLSGKRATFIASDLKTGEIITLVSSPEYDLNFFTSRITDSDWRSLIQDPEKPLQNRAIVGEYPPGSVFKVVVALALLENGVSPDETIYDPGYFQLGSYIWKDWKEEGHGEVNLERSIIQSCNTYFYQMGYRLGYTKIHEVMQKFGLGEKTGLDIPGERQGLLPDQMWKRRVIKESWYPGDTINISIGQGYLLTTPIQILQIYAAIANEGFYFEPRVVDRIQTRDGYTYIQSEKRILDIDIENLKFVKDALRDVVEDSQGTGQILKRAGLKAAGKTGSAQNPHYEETHAWFAGYYPYDEPEIAFVSFIEGGGHGGSSAGPYVRDFLLEYRKINKEGE